MRTVAQVEKEVVIKAPPDKVFGYVTVPTNLPEIWPSLVDVTDVKPLPNGGNRFNWTYKMAGMHFRGTSEDTEVVPNEQVVSTNKGGIESIITWCFQPDYGGTRVSFQADYTVPIPLLGKLAEGFVVRQNEREAELLLANLRARMEARKIG
jgi:uncharacterized protein YndB with AHSA1/START domain